MQQNQSIEWGDSKFDTTPLTYDSLTEIYGGDEPGYFFGYYARKAYNSAESAWNKFLEWREANYAKYGPWIG